MNINQKNHAEFSFVFCHRCTIFIYKMEYNIEILIPQGTLERRVFELAYQVNQKYKNRELIIISVLKGGFIITADIVKNLIDVDAKIDFLMASSYGKNTQSSFNVKIIKDIDYDIKGKHVLIIDDILDTGLTLKKVIEILSTRNPKSIEILVLLDKVAKRKVEIPCQYVGFEIDDYFVVGYGIDYAEKHRALPYIGKVILKKNKK